MIRLSVYISSILFLWASSILSQPSPTTWKKNGYLINKSADSVGIEVGGDTVWFSSNGVWFLNYHFPVTDGTSGQVLKTDGSGALTWQADATGSGSGSDTALYLGLTRGTVPVTYWSANGDTLVTIDDHGDTLRFYHNGSVWVMDGGEGLAITDSMLVDSIMYFVSAGQTDTTWITNVFLDSVRAGNFGGGGGGTTDSTRLGNGLAIRTSAQDSIAAPTDTLEADTTVLATVGHAENYADSAIGDSLTGYSLTTAIKTLIGDSLVNYFDTASVIDTVQGMGYILTESDPVWISDSGDYAMKTWVQTEIEDSLNEYLLISEVGPFIDTTTTDTIQEAHHAQTAGYSDTADYSNRYKRSVIWDFDLNSWRVSRATDSIVFDTTGCDSSAGLHPSIVYIQNGWPFAQVDDSGYEIESHQLWMVQTPYYSGAGCYENPNIYWADQRDKKNWFTPSKTDTSGSPTVKARVPLSVGSVGGSGSGTNSDPSLTIGPDNKLYVYYRWVESQGADTTEKIYVTYSTNGVDWADSLALFSTGRVTKAMSPVVSYCNDGIWRMWTIDRDSDNVIMLDTAFAYDGFDTIGNVTCTLSNIPAGGWYLWQMQIKETPGPYILVATMRKGTDYTNWLGKSYDGINFTLSDDSLTGASGISGAFDEDFSYTGCIVPRYTNYGFVLDYFYTGRATSGSPYDIGYTTIYFNDSSYYSDSTDISLFDTDDLAEGSTNLYDQPLPDSGNWSTAYDSSQHDYLRSTETAADVDTTGAQISAAMNAHDALYDNFSELAGQMDSTQIKDGHITFPKLSYFNSGTSGDVLTYYDGIKFFWTPIDSNYVTDGGLSGSDLHDTTITATQIKTGAVTSAKVLDSSIEWHDLSEAAHDSARSQVNLSVIGDFSVFGEIGSVNHLRRFDLDNMYITYPDTNLKTRIPEYYISDSSGGALDDQYAVVHPAPTAFPNKYKGYFYWLWGTPYDNGANHENPCLWVSNDNDAWAEWTDGVDTIHNPVFVGSMDTVSDTATGAIPVYVDNNGAPKRVDWLSDVDGTWDANGTHFVMFRGTVNVSGGIDTDFVFVSSIDDIISGLQPIAILKVAEDTVAPDSLVNAAISPTGWLADTTSVRFACIVKDPFLGPDADTVNEVFIYEASDWDANVVIDTSISGSDTIYCRRDTSFHIVDTANWPQWTYDTDYSKWHIYIKRVAPGYLLSLAYMSLGGGGNFGGYLEIAESFDNGSNWNVRNTPLLGNGYGLNGTNWSSLYRSGFVVLGQDHLGIYLSQSEHGNNYETLLYAETWNQRHDTLEPCAFELTPFPDTSYLGDSILSTFERTESNVPIRLVDSSITNTNYTHINDHWRGMAPYNMIIDSLIITFKTKEGAGSSLNYIKNTALYGPEKAGIRSNLASTLWWTDATDSSNGSITRWARNLPNNPDHTKRADSLLDTRAGDYWRVDYEVYVSDTLDYLRIQQIQILGHKIWQSDWSIE